MPSSVDLLVEAERRGILPEDKKPLLAEARRRGLVPGGTPPATTGHPADVPDMSSEQAAKGLSIPQEGRSEPLTPLAPVKEYLGYAADKSAQARAKMPGAQTLPGALGQAALGGAMRVGEAGLRAAQGFAPSTPGEVGATLLAGPAGQGGEALVKGAARPFLKYGGKLASEVGEHLADLAGAWTGKDPEYIKAVFAKPGIMRKVGEAIGLDIQKSATEAIETGRSELGKRVKQAEDGLALFGTRAVNGNPNKVDLQTPLRKIVGALEHRGHHVPQSLGGHAYRLEKYALDPTTPDYKLVTKYLADLKKDMNFGEALNLRRELDQVINHGIRGSDGLQRVTGPANSILSDIRFRVNQALTQSIRDPEARAHWAQINRAASQGFEAFDKLQKQIIGSEPYQSALRVARNVKNKTVEEQVLGPAGRISQEAEKSVEEIHDRVIAAQFKRRYKSGMNDLIIPSSPRAVGRVTQLLSGSLDHAEGATRALADFAANHPTVTAQSLLHIALKHAEERRQRAMVPTEAP